MKIIKAIILIMYICFANISTHAITFQVISFVKSAPHQKISDHCYHCKISSRPQLLFEYQSRSYLSYVNNCHIISNLRKNFYSSLQHKLCFLYLLLQNNSFIVIRTFACLLSSPIQIENQCNFLDAYEQVGVVSAMFVHSFMETTIFFASITF